MKLGGKLSLVAGATQSSEASSTKASDEYDMHSHPSAHPRPDFIANAQQTFALTVVSLTGAQWEGDVREVSLPGEQGRFGVMAKHTPMLTTLREGMILVHPETGEPPFQLYVSGGFVEVQPTHVTVLADLALRSEDQDRAKAEVARNAANSPMATSLTDDAYSQTHAELMHHFGAGPRAKP
ncbi:ATP synthase F1 subunit epsilon [Xanthomonas arboricola pv. juglandis]|jgi:F-type H+-transporting ATPase subunit epsilon|uniref:ATP synthase F1 subunit epsilon n=1 Tax=Xanthomonas arboricola TaxID=56448 RepID=UPI000B18E2E0|nr:ATP synthase F1 subunit epsilon [Xanthomonas arboricola]MDN0234327.1 ATP synthase F1 subunit epsilon [Xanthomonas arboricola pv. juglandis]MDN0238624.1 ATP synthase F1 subunit epsilon [Xanthomonas arboricola pv. juglandis]MDN0242108.1 ATP synthase F1 subunit epsilon [Xanthomonas arboricola pv. juglandis]MDN0254685.1 ATP synthase F1 subunit epsilon [Xanthomonas arboricola pv. juglandis]MDN0258467.1 ATP synthase F1 subunit epsilon [Xanthomonas arboricola pv. juglandis]